MSDWEESDSDTKPPAPAPKAPIIPKKSKWQGEDEENEDPVSDWEESSEEEDEKPASAPVAPPRKKGTLKQKLAEKEAEKARKLAAGEDEDDDDDDDDDEYDSDSVLDPIQKAKRDQARQMQSDLNNAAELFGAAALGGPLFRF